MDLITHIPGVGPTAAFNPGATTPAPYNVPHTGALDGTGPGTATKNVAELYNRNLLWRRALIAAAGLAFDPTNWVQEVQAFQLLISAAAAPPGDVHYFAQSTAPTGYLKANGAAISRGTYATLFAAIGTTFGAGDGATTFALPDLRGEFIRGWDDARGVDVSRAFGSAQKGSLIGYDTNNDGVWCATAVGPVSTAASQITMGVDVIPVGDYPGVGLMGAAPASSSGIPGDGVGQGASGVARPRNIALLACIKY